MTIDEFRLEMIRFEASAYVEAEAMKNPVVALERLDQLYLAFDRDERDMASKVIAEWLLAGNKRRVFDALHLCWRFAIVDSLPALRELAARLGGSRDRMARYDLAKVNGIIAELAGTGIAG